MEIDILDFNSYFKVCDVVDRITAAALFKHIAHQTTPYLFTKVITTFLSKYRKLKVFQQSRVKLYLAVRCRPKQLLSIKAYKRVMTFTVHHELENFD